MMEQLLRDPERHGRRGRHDPFHGSDLSPSQSLAYLMLVPLIKAKITPHSRQMRSTERSEILKLQACYTQPIFYCD